MRTERHPTLGILVREDGCVYLPKSGKWSAHWTFGTKRNDRGYLGVQIKGKRHYVHRLVAQTFIPNPQNKPQIDHIDRCPTNNNVENLRWVTDRENTRNTRANDRVEARGDIHWYEDVKQFCKKRGAEYRKTHRLVLFSNGKSRWLSNEQATELLKLPVSERVWK